MGSSIKFNNVSKTVKTHMIDHHRLYFFMNMQYFFPFYLVSHFFLKHLSVWKWKPAWQRPRTRSCSPSCLRGGTRKHKRAPRNRSRNILQELEYCQPASPWSGCVIFVQNKLTYFDLFSYFIKGKIGPKFSHLLMVRLRGVTHPPPPPPPHTHTHTHTPE